MTGNKPRKAKTRNKARKAKAREQNDMNRAVNRLAGETSPYLLQHRDNPVHWQPWGRNALAMAEAGDRPILLSVGYAACHWCHVMAHESFEDAAIAAQMNAGFVNIKVDREERPDLDAIYQSALGALGEQGGWPLTMFLKPDGTPFWGGTYFPPEARYGRPGFPDVLRQISATWAGRKDQVEQNARALKDALTRISGAGAQGGADGAGSLSLETLDDVAGMAGRMIDYHHGGTLGAPKFPQPVFFRFLWHSYLRTRDRRAFEAVIITLNNICQGGIYDHLGGGFSRYSVDAYWLAPHFEKMLYDNALLVELLCDVWQETGLPLCETRIRETVAWMLADLRTEANDGLYALASAFDADSEGEEGKYYVWSLAEVESVLGDEAAEFCAAYDVSADGNWEGHTILRRRVDDVDDTNGDGGDDTDGDDTGGGRARRLRDCRRKLLAARLKRIPPERDDKVLADWNGMAVCALARAGTLFDEPDWIAAARGIYDFVLTHMQDSGRLYHTWCAGRARHPAVVDDYAHMSRAALALCQAAQGMTQGATQQTAREAEQAAGQATEQAAAYLDQARAWVAIADKHYWDADAGGYFMAADDTDDLIMRTKTLYDNAVPSGGGVMLDVLARLWHMTGDTAFRDRAEALVSAMAPAGRAAPADLAGPAGQADTRVLLNQPALGSGFEMLAHGLQIVVVAPDSEDSVDSANPDGADLFQAALRAAPAQAVVMRVSADRPLPDTHPAAGKGLVDGRAAAYICRGPVCGLPVTTAGDLIARLKQEETR